MHTRTHARTHTRTHTATPASSVSYNISTGTAMPYPTTTRAPYSVRFYNNNIMYCMSVMLYTYWYTKLAIVFVTDKSTSHPWTIWLP